MTQPVARRIFVVEDDRHIADMLANYLQAQGYAPLVLDDGLLVLPELFREKAQAAHAYFRKQARLLKPSEQPTMGRAA